MEYCNRIYGLERQFAEYPPEERKEKRQAELKPLLEDIREEISDAVPGIAGRAH